MEKLAQKGNVQQYVTISFPFTVTDYELLEKAERMMIEIMGPINMVPFSKFSMDGVKRLQESWVQYSCMVDFRLVDVVVDRLGVALKKLLNRQVVIGLHGATVIHAL